MGSCRFLLLNICKQYSKLSLYNSTSCVNTVFKNDLLQNSVQTSVTSIRFSHSFFSRISAEKLWKGVTSVSNAGRRKGRGKGSSRKGAKDLNRGQVIGFGKRNMLWPGLNAPVVQGREVLRQQELPPDEERQKRILEMRSKSGFKRRNYIHPLERGWSGTKLVGRSLGPPDPVGDENFEGFDSRVIQFIIVTHMHGQRGRVRNFASLVVVGNKNGLAGFGRGKSNIGNTAAKRAKNKAVRALRYIELDGTTVIHDFFTEYAATRIFVERRAPGSGVVAHRAIRAMCELIGIKDLYCKCEGNTGNTYSVARAFFIGLMKQRSLKEIANEKGLNIVKLQKNRDYFPEVVATPDRCRTKEEIPVTERLEFDYHLHKEKVVQERKKYEPFYINFPSHIKEMKDREKLRNHRDVRIHLMAKYGALKSHVQIQLEEKAKQKLKETVEEQS